MSDGMADATQIAHEGLHRHIGAWGMLLTGLTGIIGSGWLFASLYAVQIAGPAAVISWLIGCLLALTLALIYAELGALIPAAGALARIPFVALGPLGGFLSGWLCWIAYVAMVSIEVTAVLGYAGNYLPWLTETIGTDRILTGRGILVAALLIAVFTAINIAGVKWMIRSNIAITIWKLAVPVLVGVMLIIAGFQAENFTAYGGFAPYGINGILGAVSSGGIIFSFVGFRSVIDLAGEARNPARNVPLALVGSVVICLVIYVLLQVALIGAIPAEHLKDGWAGVVENFAAGPFAGLALILGLQWMALLVFADAIISPGGTALAYVGSSGRINYSMAQTGLFPKFFAHLNRNHVPANAMAVNSVIGIIILAPLPGWPQLAGFISSAAVLSLAIGPVALVVLRRQAADYQRPFRIPFAHVFSTIAFIFVGFIVYWSGWQTNWKILLIALAGFAYFALRNRLRREPAPLYVRHTGWLIVYYIVLAIISWLGNFGGGLGVIPVYLDSALIIVLSVTIFQVAVGNPLPIDVVRRFIADTDAKKVAG
ncbi:APC family permease [Hoeflea poritis]|uniref:APC family permease n=1 Tax=Hoeflea poritis TaxID=2993659 RepID=A0ABT4VLQ5_9HYPH|nr:APC family permease [Hoeflea poritis]MDA4845641.1 APC family permease [Hoeflea poritis]